MRTAAFVISSVLLIVAFAVVGYVLGHGSAPDQQEFDSERAKAFEVGYAQGREQARSRSLREGRTDGRSAGRARGKARGSSSGADDGQAAADAELARIEEEQIAAEEAAVAQAAEEAELAVPAPCRGLPESTAKRMCIGAVEAGVYP
jgi:hypothetical protein